MAKQNNFSYLIVTSITEPMNTMYLDTGGGEGIFFN